MGISLIVAYAKNRVIGGDNKMLWHLSGDFKYFKRTTIGKPIIMGRKTYDSIGRPLPDRTNIVITRNPTWKTDGVQWVDSVDSALELAQSENMDEIMVIGGGNIYAQTMELADTLYITEVDLNTNGDTVFPEIDNNIWHKKSVSQDMVENNITYRLVVYKR